MSTVKDYNLREKQNCLCFHLRKSSRVMTQYYESQLRGGGLRLTQSSILTALSMRPNWTMAELSSALGQERTTLIRNLGLLKRKGLVASSPGLGRPANVAITAKGRQALESVHPAWGRVQGSVAKVLGDKRWAEILADLERVSEVLSKEAGK